MLAHTLIHIHTQQRRDTSNLVFICNIYLLSLNTHSNNINTRTIISLRNKKIQTGSSVVSKQ